MTGLDRARARMRVLLVSMVLAPAMAVPALCELHLDAQATKRLSAGEVLVEVAPDETGEADGKIEAAIDIAAAPAAIFAVMTDCARTLKFVEELTVCKVLEVARDGSYDIREHHSRWLAILPEMVSVFRSDYVGKSEIRFSRVSGDLKFLQGSWQLQPLADGAGTRVIYRARVGVDMPLPGFLIRGSLENDIPRLLRSLRAEVLSGP